MGTGVITSLLPDILTDNASSWRTDDLAGIFVNPNINQPVAPPTIFKILFNDYISVTVDNSAGNLTDIAAAGDTYQGVYHFNDLTVTNGARVITQDDVNYDTLNIVGGLLDAANLPVPLQGKLKKKNPLIRFARLIKGLFFRNEKPEVRSQKPSKRITMRRSGKKSSLNSSLSEAKNPDNPVKKEIRQEKQKKVKTSTVIENKPVTRNFNPATRMVSLTSTNTATDANPESLFYETGKNINNQLTNKKSNTKLLNKLDKITPKMNAQHQKAAEQKTILSGTDPIYTYDQNNNRTTMTDPTGMTSYTYDVLNRLTSITNPKGKTTSFSYDAIGRRTGMSYANGVTASYGYDNAGRLLSLVNQIGATTVSTFSYSYDRVGNRTQMVDADGTHNYLYDQLYRLIDATHPQPTNPAENFSYDPVGNRTASQISTGYTYDNMNRLLSDDQYTYQYDANGNLTSKTDKSDSSTMTYQYDAENRLIQVTSPASQINYQYDGMARLIVRTVNGVTTKYVYDEKDVLLELDDTNQNKARYTRTLDIDELISVDRNTTNDGILDTTHYYHRDGLGSITAMTDSGGVVAASYVYDSLGSIKNQTGSVENRYTYTFREWDQEAGLYYYRARFYDSMQGRFLQEDSKGFDAGINFYIYVQNNPVNAVDPMGLYNPFGPNPQTPGCDVNGDFNKCARKCCDAHDRCYERYGCNALTWTYSGFLTKNFSNCAKCNTDAVICLVKAAIKCDEC